MSKGAAFFQVVGLQLVEIHHEFDTSRKICAHGAVLVQRRAATVPCLNLCGYGYDIRFGLGGIRDDGRDGSFESVSFPSAIYIQRGGTWLDRGVWEFDLSGLPAGTIQSITLEIYVIFSATNDGEPFDIDRYIGNGVIETTDATAGTLFAANVDGTSPQDIDGTRTFDVTAFILDPAVQAAGYAGFAARLSDEASLLTHAMQLQDPGSLGDEPPWLVVEFTPPSSIPLPASLLLLGTALGVLGLLGWRRHNHTVALSG